MQYSETHKNYYCSQIILYLKRKLQKFEKNESYEKEEEKYNIDQVINDENCINMNELNEMVK